MAYSLPSSTTRAELDQAHSLILRGKAHAAAGDPKMQRIINYLSAMGYQTAQSRVDRQQFLRKQYEVSLSGSEVVEVSPGLFKYRDPKTGNLSFTSSREFAQQSAIHGTPEFTQEYQQAYKTESSPIPFSQIQNQLVSFDTQKSAIKQEAGILTVTQKEAQLMQGSTKPYWVAESKTPREAITESAFTGSVSQVGNIYLGGFSRKGQDTYKQYRLTDTRGSYEYNFQNILAGKETYKQYKSKITDFEKDPASFKGQTGVTSMAAQGGISYSLTPLYFEKNIDMDKIHSDALVKSKTRFSNLPIAIQSKLMATGFGKGVSSTVLGVGEFAATMSLNLGVQTFEAGKGEFGKTRTFKFGGALGKIRSYPTTQTTVKFLDSPGKYLKQKGSSPEFLGQATVIIPLAFQGIKSVAGNIKRFGFKEGAVEIASGLSPFRIKSGIYAESITQDTKFTNVKSFKATSDKTTLRIFSGSSGNIRMSGMEKSAIIKDKTMGGGYSVTRTPFYELRGGGIFLTKGVRSTVTPYTFGSSGTGSVYKAKGNDFVTQILSQSLKGGTSNIVSAKGVTIHATEKSALMHSDLTKAYRITGGSAYKDIDEGVVGFISGRATPSYQLKYYGDKKDFIYSPSGRYKLNPQISGKEYDLNVIFGKGNIKGSASFKKEGSETVSIHKFKSGGVNPVLPIIRPATLSTTTTTLPPQPATHTLPKTSIKASQYAGLGYYEKTEGGLMPGQIQTFKKDTATKTIQVVIPATKKIYHPSDKSKLIISPVPVIDAITKPKIKQDVVTTPQVIQVKKIKLAQTQDYITTIPPLNYGMSGYTYPNVPFPTPTPVPIPVMMGGGAFMKLGNIQPRKSPSRYIPSFKALFFKIKGHAPTGKLTGLRLRPITPGFSFTKTLTHTKQIIRVRRIRI